MTTADYGGKSHENIVTRCKILLCSRALWWHLYVPTYSLASKWDRLSIYWFVQLFLNFFSGWPHIVLTPAEVYHIYKTEMDLLNLEEEPCNGTEGDIDFETCIRDSVEEKINCTIPDMMSGVPVAPVGRGDKPLCSTSEEYGNYSQIYQSMELTSEGDIFKDYGCLPKCQGCLTWTYLHETQFGNLYDLKYIYTCILYRE